MWGEIYDRVAELALQHRSTLVFVNTRRLAERMAHAPGRAHRRGAGRGAPRILSRKLRLDAERKLKNGEIRLLVATASLELGIDIGSVDLVCQIGSTRSMAVTLQRVGRAGHWRGAVPKGRLFVTTRDDLLECAAVVRAIRLGDLDRLQIPEAPLDILSQQIVAMCSSKTGTRMRCSNACVGPIPIASCGGKNTTRIWKCCRRALPPSAAVTELICSRQVNRRLRGRRGRDWLPSPAAEPSPIRRCSR